MKNRAFIEPSWTLDRSDTWPREGGAGCRRCTMMGWYNDGWSYGWMFAMMLGWTVLIAAAVWAVVALTRTRQSPTAPPSGRESAVDLLDRRLAAGEITPDEYLAVRSVLEAHTPTSGRAA
jgi:putative membrane protein